MNSPVVFHRHPRFSLNSSGHTAILLVLACWSRTLFGGGVVMVCDEASLNAALASGGTVTFACDGTISISATKVIAQDTTLDATGRTVALDGGGAVRLL